MEETIKYACMLTSNTFVLSERWEDHVDRTGVERYQREYDMMASSGPITKDTKKKKNEN
jgi:hypothetical protein